MKITPRWLVAAGLSLLALTACEPESRSAQHPTAPALSLASTDYFLIEGGPAASEGSLSLSRIIDISGGAIHLAGHSIEVPSGAVRLPTLFTVRVLSDGYIEVELTAVVTTLLRRVIDVGSDGFLGGNTVDLTLSYASATNVVDPADLVILRVLDDGRVEPLDVVVDEARNTVTAKLDHFSRYCLASN